MRRQEATTNGDGRVRGNLPGRFHLLFGGAVISNLGDGLAATAFPLLAAALTTDPLSIAVVMAAGDLPFAVFAVFGGVLADHLDRRRIMIVTDALMALAATGLVVCILNHAIDVAGLALFSAAIGVGACTFAIASQAALPDVVGGLDRPRLSRANGRLFGSQVLGVQLVGPAVGGVMFAADHHLPFLLDAVSFAAGAALIALIPGQYRSAPADRPPPLRAAIAAGVTHVARSRLLRTITLVFAGTNLILAAEESVLVVLAERRLGLGATGYGLLFASLAVGGLAAAAVAGRMAQHWHEATVFRLGFTLFPLGALATGLAPDPVTCGVGLAATSFGVMTLNVTGGALRQAVLPPNLMGRAYAVMTALGKATLPVGAVLGGLVARLSPRAPFVGAAVVAAALLVVALRGLSRPVIDTARGVTAGDGADVLDATGNAHPGRQT